MKQEVIEAYIKAGKIASKARAYAKTLCVEDTPALDIAEKTEEMIRKLGGELAFPVNISINEIAAHYSPIADDKLKLKKGDLVKIDLGVQMRGYIADTAISASVGKSKDNKELIAAAEKALDAAIKTLKPNVTLTDIGKAISSSVTGTNIKIIKNLSGHGLEQYEIHSGLNIPNYETGNQTKLNDCAIAIEPFATRGAGLVVDAQPAKIYRIINKKPMRAGREILNYAWKKYKTLPFSLRELIKKFGALKTKMVVRGMLANEIVKEYTVLREKNKKKVAQAEHTILILNNKVIVTTK